MVYSVFILIIQYFNSNNAGDFWLLRGFAWCFTFVEYQQHVYRVCIYKWIKSGKFKKKEVITFVTHHPILLDFAIISGY